MTSCLKSLTKWTREACRVSLMKRWTFWIWLMLMQAMMSLLTKVASMRYVLTLIPSPNKSTRSISLSSSGCLMLQRAASSLSLVYFKHTSWMLSLITSCEDRITHISLTTNLIFNWTSLTRFAMCKTPSLSLSFSASLSKLVQRKVKNHNWPSKQALPQSQR